MTISSISFSILSQLTTSLPGSKIQARETEEWKSRLWDLSKTRLYRQLKPDRGFDDYLVEITERDHRRVFTQIRSGTHELYLEKGRWSDIQVEERCVWRVL